MTMKVTRRQMVLASVSMMLTGCATDQQMTGIERPGPIWPEDVTRPVPSGQALVVPSRPVPPPVNPVTPPPAAPAVASGPVRAISRASWAKADPIGSRINRMGNVQMITVHHEGWTPVWFEDTKSTADRLDGIRRSHIDRLRAGDIGYHYIIDRAGRVWEGRNTAYQGAHVREHNENNLGIMVLGNFDQQQPSTAQISTLRSVIVASAKQYRVPVSKVYTHKELNRTECPGKVLQAHMATIRRNGLG